MYKFWQCTYEELHRIICQYEFGICPWEIIHPDYMDGLEVVESPAGEIVALIYYDPHRNENCEMFIMEFEVRNDLWRKGHGKHIILQFLAEHQTSAELLPLGDVSVRFWQSCGFEGDSLGLYYYPEE